MPLPGSMTSRLRASVRARTRPGPSAGATADATRIIITIMIMIICYYYYYDYDYDYLLLLLLLLLLRGASGPARPAVAQAEIKRGLEYRILTFSRKLPEVSRDFRRFL